MSRSKSSGRWLQEHFSDTYVKRAQEQGYRSRASFKLLEIQEKYRIFRPGKTVLDLGAAPGGWSQVAKELVGDQGVVVASDILEMAPIDKVSFIQGDFTEQAVYDQIIATLDGRSLDLVISDMAPNISGISEVDIPRAMHLVELALDIALNTLKAKGDFLVKIFQGPGFEELLRDARSNFDKVQMLKPAASRSRSKEQYLLARGFRG